MGYNYVPPPIVYPVEDCSIPAAPYYYECEIGIINLAAATRFYVDHFPFTSYYWPCVKIAGDTYYLTSSMKTKEEAMKFLKNLTEKIEGRISLSESKESK